MILCVMTDFDPTRTYNFAPNYIEQLEEDLGAANAKIMLIKVALVAPPSAEVALELIREVLDSE